MMASRMSVVTLAMLGAARSAAAVTPTPSDSLPPATPEGLPACSAPLLPDAGGVRWSAERFEYAVKVIGVPLGAVHIETTRRGRYEGQAVTEFRGWIDPDPAVSAMTTLEGKALALVPDQGFTPLKSMLRYRFRGDVVREEQTHANAGHDVVLEKDRNGERTRAHRQFPSPVHDFLSGFMLLRRLPKDAQGCAVLLGNDKAYTIWVEPQGAEVLDTAKGRMSFDRYLMKYGSDKTATVRDVVVWISSGPERVPYQAKGLTKYSPVIVLTGYHRGA